MEYVTANILGAIPVLFILWRRPDLRRPMIIVGLMTMPLSLFDLLYVPSYWIPRTLFDLPIGIEGFVFSFEMGALICGIYAYVFKRRFKKIRGDRSWLSLLPLAAVLPIVFTFNALVPINITIAMNVGLVFGILWLLITRQSLRWSIAGSAAAFGVVYFSALCIWAMIHPSALDWFTLDNLPRLVIVNVVVYELVFGLLFAAFWSNVYPLVFGYELVHIKAPKRRSGATSGRLVRATHR